MKIETRSPAHVRYNSHMPQPSIGKIVYFRQSSIDDSPPLAAIISAVRIVGEEEVEVDLTIFKPSGPYYMRGVLHSPDSNHPLPCSWYWPVIRT